MIKLIFIDTQSISHDEPFTMYHAQFDLGYLIDYLKNYNNPPLFEIILHFWIKVFGISEVSVRILPMLFSSFTVIFIYKTGVAFFDKKMALVSCLLFTFSTLQIWYAHDCRVYSLFLLLTTVSFFLFFKLLKEGRLSKWNVFLFLLVNDLLVYAHYFGVFVWFIEAIIVVLYYFKNRIVLKYFFTVMLCATILYVPQLLLLFQRFNDAKNGTWLKPPVGIESLYNMLWSFSNAPVVTVSVILLMVAALVKFFAFTNRSVGNPFVKYVIIWFAFPFCLMFCISYKVPMFLDRYLIYITPAFYLILSICLSFLFKNVRIYYLSAGVLILLFILSVSLNADKKREVKQTVDFVKTQKDKNTLVLICSPDFATNFVYYYNINYFKSIAQDKEYDAMEKMMNQENVYFINRMDSNLYNKIDEFDKLIYLDAGADFSVPNNHIKEDLIHKYHLKEEKFHVEMFHTYVFNLR